MKFKEEVPQDEITRGLSSMLPMLEGIKADPKSEATIALIRTVRDDLDRLAVMLAGWDDFRREAATLP